MSGARGSADPSLAAAHEVSSPPRHAASSPDVIMKTKYVLDPRLKQDKEEIHRLAEQHVMKVENRYKKLDDKQLSILAKKLKKDKRGSTHVQKFLRNVELEVLEHEMSSRRKKLTDQLSPSGVHQVPSPVHESTITKNDDGSRLVLDPTGGTVQCVVNGQPFRRGQLGWCKTTRSSSWDHCLFANTIPDVGIVAISKKTSKEFLLEAAQLLELPATSDNKFPFQVSWPDVSYKLRLATRSQEERDVWFCWLQRCIDGVAQQDPTRFGTLYKYSKNRSLMPGRSGWEEKLVSLTPHAADMGKATLSYYSIKFRERQRIVPLSTPVEQLQVLVFGGVEHTVIPLARANSFLALPMSAQEVKDQILLESDNSEQATHSSRSETECSQPPALSGQQSDVGEYESDEFQDPVESEEEDVRMRSPARATRHQDVLDDSEFSTPLSTSRHDAVEANQESFPKQVEDLLPLERDVTLPLDECAKNFQSLSLANERAEPVNAILLSLKDSVESVYADPPTTEQGAQVVSLALGSVQSVVAALLQIRDTPQLESEILVAVEELHPSVERMAKLIKSRQVAENGQLARSAAQLTKLLSTLVVELAAWAMFAQHDRAKKLIREAKRREIQSRRQMNESAPPVMILPPPPPLESPADTVVPSSQVNGSPDEDVEGCSCAGSTGAEVRDRQKLSDYGSVTDYIATEVGDVEETSTSERKDSFSNCHVAAEVDDPQEISAKENNDSSTNSTNGHMVAEVGDPQATREKENNDSSTNSTNGHMVAEVGDPQATPEKENKESSSIGHKVAEVGDSQNKLPKEIAPQDENMLKKESSSEAGQQMVLDEKSADHVMESTTSVTPSDVGVQGSIPTHGDENMQQRADHVETLAEEKATVSMEQLIYQRVSEESDVEADRNKSSKRDVKAAKGNSNEHIAMPSPTSEVQQQAAAYNSPAPTITESDLDTPYSVEEFQSSQAGSQKADRQRLSTSSTRTPLPASEERTDTESHKLDLLPQLEDEKSGLADVIDGERTAVDMNSTSSVAGEQLCTSVTSLSPDKQDAGMQQITSEIEDVTRDSSDLLPPVTTSDDIIPVAYLVQTSSLTALSDHENDLDLFQKAQTGGASSQIHEKDSTRVVTTGTAPVVKENDTVSSPSSVKGSFKTPAGSIKPVSHSIEEVSSLRTNKETKTKPISTAHVTTLAEKKTSTVTSSQSKETLSSPPLVSTSSQSANPKAIDHSGIKSLSPEPKAVTATEGLAIRTLDEKKQQKKMKRSDQEKWNGPDHSLSRPGSGWALWKPELSEKWEHRFVKFSADEFEVWCRNVAGEWSEELRVSLGTIQLLPGKDEFDGVCEIRILVLSLPCVFEIMPYSSSDFEQWTAHLSAHCGGAQVPAHPREATKPTSFSRKVASSRPESTSYYSKSYVGRPVAPRRDTSTSAPRHQHHEGLGTGVVAVETQGTERGRGKPQFRRQQHSSSSVLSSPEWMGSQQATASSSSQRGRDNHSFVRRNEMAEAPARFEPRAVHRGMVESQRKYRVDPVHEISTSPRTQHVVAGRRAAPRSSRAHERGSGLSMDRSSTFQEGSRKGRSRLGVSRWEPSASQRLSPRSPREEESISRLLEGFEVETVGKSGRGLVRALVRLSASHDRLLIKELGLKSAGSGTEWDTAIELAHVVRVTHGRPSAGMLSAVADASEFLDVRACERLLRECTVLIRLAPGVAGREPAPLDLLTRTSGECRELTRAISLLCRLPGHFR